MSWDLKLPSPSTLTPAPTTANTIAICGKLRTTTHHKIAKVDLLKMERILPSTEQSFYDGSNINNNYTQVRFRDRRVFDRGQAFVLILRLLGRHRSHRVYKYRHARITIIMNGFSNDISCMSCLIRARDLSQRPNKKIRPISYTKPIKQQKSFQTNYC